MFKSKNEKLIELITAKAAKDPDKEKTYYGAEFISYCKLYDKSKIGTIEKIENEGKNLSVEVAHTEHGPIVKIIRKRLKTDEKEVSDTYITRYQGFIPRKNILGSSQWQYADVELCDVSDEFYGPNDSLIHPMSDSITIAVRNKNGTFDIDQRLSYHPQSFYNNEVVKLLIGEFNGAMQAKQNQSES